MEYDPNAPILAVPAVGQSGGTSPQNMNGLINIFKNLTPEQRRQIAAGGALDDEAQSVDKQLAQAQALRTHYAAGHTTGIGAAGGALGDLFNSIHSNQLEKEARDRQKGIRAEQTSLRGTQMGAYGDALTAEQERQQAMARAAALRGKPVGDFGGGTGDDGSGV